MKKILLCIALCPLFSFAQYDSVVVGAKFVKSERLDYKIHADWKRAWSSAALDPTTTWTVKKLEEKYVLFENAKTDSFWFFRNDLYDAFSNYKLFSLAEYKKYEKKFGKPSLKKALTGQTWIGMDEDLTLIAKGSPETVNRTKTASATSEQWVYEGYKTEYFYFTNGKLKTIQD